MDWTRGVGQRRLAAGAVGAFGLLLGLEALKEEGITAVDLFADAAGIALVVGCSVCVALLSSRLDAQEVGSRDLRQELARLEDRDQRWRAELAEHFRELGAAIQRQFAAWGFTAAEQDVGLLLLKGFSHKEIARIRDTGETTIRQQATGLYQKAGLSGRAALSAYFLEELLQPPEPPAPGRDRRANGRDAGANLPA